MEDDFVGAIKIKDGLFIGDEYAAQDFEFIVTNKVTHIINCAGKQIPNYWETVGVVYLTYDWMDSENQVVFDAKGEVVNEIYNFVEEAVKQGEGVLVHSLKGQSRSCCVLTAYFMKRYRWSLYKTLEFLTSRRSDLEIRTSFYHQLLNLESRLFQQADGNVTVNWHESGPEHDHEEALLRNTFLNARNAPFDEALVNPQLQGADTRPRKLNWGDEKGAAKIGLFSYFTKESLAARLAKPLMNNIKSILKGSNKVFKHKHKNQDDDSTGSSKNTSATNSGMRMHKSVRNLSEGRNVSGSDLPDTTKTSDKESGIVDKSQELTPVPKGSKSANMQRSSSATYLERDENSRSPITGKSAVATTADKGANGKISNINGNIIHLTVNNYLAPVNNLNNTSGSAEAKDQSSKPPVAPSSQASRSSLPKYGAPTDGKKEEETYSSSKGHSAEPSSAGLNPTQVVEKSMMSTNQLKSAIEKKLSKEYKSQMPSLKKGETPVIATKITANSEHTPIEPKSVKSVKPNDIKVNYQVLLKNRETPPPRKREDAKKIPESPQRKAVTKSSISSTKGNNDSGLPYSSYLNNLFSTSFSHLNTVTPSAYATNYSNSGDKAKTPGSAKATPVTYNLNLSQKAQTLTRPQRATSNQVNDKDYNSSTLGSSLTKSKLVYTNTPNSVSNLATKYNNYLAQTKNNPVRITYEKIDRPHSATPDRSQTPQAGVRRMGTPSNVGLNRSGGTTDQRLSVPTKGTKHAKKDSGSTQDLLAKYRQRSSSPSQMSYNPVLSSSALSSKSRAKY